MTKTYDPTSKISVDPTVTDPHTGKVTLQSAACWTGSCGPMFAGAPPQTYTLALDPVAIVPPAGTALPDGGTLSNVQIRRSGAATDGQYTSMCWSTDGTTTPDCTCAGATAENAPATVGPGLYVSSGDATPAMQVTRAQGASGITVRAVGCTAGYAPSNAPFATVTWN